MKRQFFCNDCGSEHDEPADARLGHLVPCMFCALFAEIGSHAPGEAIVEQCIAA